MPKTKKYKYKIYKYADTWWVRTPFRPATRSYNTYWFATFEEAVEFVSLLV